MEKPTNEEIDDVIMYFKCKDAGVAHKRYIKPLIDKHGQAWVSVVMQVVFKQILQGKIK